MFELCFMSIDDGAGCKQPSDLTLSWDSHSVCYLIPTCDKIYLLDKKGRMYVVA